MGLKNAAMDTLTIDGIDFQLRNGILGRKFECLVVLLQHSFFPNTNCSMDHDIMMKPMMGDGRITLFL